MTSAAALVVTLSAIVDLITQSRADVVVWLLVPSVFVGACVVTLPFWLPRPAQVAVGLGGSLLTGVVCAVLAMNSVTPAAIINNMLLLPLLALYLGWFFHRWVYRSAFFGLVALFLVANLVNPTVESWTAWINLSLVATFCGEAAAFLQRRLQQEIRTDELTGALNLTGWRVAADREMDRARRQKRNLVLFLIDFDEFKKLNDSDGHDAGNQVLIDAVAAWYGASRTYDVVARIGGDEFAVLCPELDTEDVPALISRLRSGSTHPLSVGHAVFLPSDTLLSLTQRADVALYTDKARETR